eukprot:TRINITY_DN3732_c0_g4_i1.p1 TRINITY_DN3732_c0_g4~~TRINITY_DN3732_c0_g4_i1.p1  ORF type:complete len:511 (+),score=86.05 TRINITY_DN3732_c0_g4_i1:36-1535(+)
MAIEEKCALPALQFLHNEEEPQSEGPPRLFHFDPGRRRLLPRRTQQADQSLGEQTEGSSLGDDSNAQEAEVEDEFCGSRLHAFTLEFDDHELEANFLSDLARRSKRWVGLMVAAAGAAHALHSCYQFWAHRGGSEPALAAALYFLQYLQLRLNRQFVVNNFQEMLFLWAILQVSCKLTLVTLADAEYVESAALSVFVTFVVSRMRFLHFAMFNLYTFACFSFCDRFSASRHLAVVCTGILWLSYAIERMQRKDFVQASTAWVECQRTDMLLQNILPVPIIQRLKHDGARHGIAQSYEGATVFFADVVSFTTMSAQITPATLVDLLNRMFQDVDALAEQNGIEKIKTIGDCYMAASGLPVANPLHAQAMARFGLQMLDYIDSGVLRNPATGQKIQVRCGIHSGPCVAGVIGQNKFYYDVWGDAVNTASRMESHGEPLKLHCSGDTYELLKQDFICEARPKMYVKGKGEMQTYFVKEERDTSFGKTFAPKELLQMLSSDAL